MQGIISGISLASGYGLGVLCSFVFRWLTNWQPSAKVRRAAWLALCVLSPVTILFYMTHARGWQNDVRRLVEESPLSNGHMIRIAVLALLVGIVLILIGRFIRFVTRKLIDFIDKFLPKRISVGLGCIVVGLFMYWAFSGVLVKNWVAASNRAYLSHNNETPEGVSKPVQPTRSGSDQSFVPWDSLGFQGKKFIGKGPSIEQLQTFNNMPAMEPVRVYVGVKSAPDAQARAKLAVEELKRTNAFSRQILIIATPTGTGWLEPQTMDSLEYMYNGNSAIVAQQYSYLPSWISFLVDRENATEASQALHDAVYAEWSKLPRESRPKLISYGLSLGSFGSQSVFNSPSNVRRMVDGAMFVGTPNTTSLWRSITKQRDAKSSEWQPQYQHGASVRFASTSADLEPNSADWEAPRIAYLQHASDPVVWFNYDLALHKPDWLREKRGSDVSESMHWYPIVTFLHVVVDQFIGTTVPDGHGHNYASSIVSAWHAVAQPPDWTEDKGQQLQQHINNY